MKEQAFKAYYITCYLLSKFKGMHSMEAEKELFDTIYDFVGGSTKRSEVVGFIELLFGLSSYQLSQSIKSYKENTDFGHEVI